MSRTRDKVAPCIAALETLSLAELRMEWQRRYGTPPRHRAADLLRRVLAWRIQSDVMGGLDATALRLLRRESGVEPAALPGMRLAREWAGRRHEVIVMENGDVLHEGKRFTSLSAAARHITGMRWNGPRFFGLRQENVR